MPKDARKKLGKYEVHKLIGRGSMGMVYKGYDPYKNRNVAIKVALSDSLNDKEAGSRYRKMFFNEAHTAGMLKHPNIIEIVDAGAESDTCYIVMELIDGSDTLKKYCQPENLLPIQQVIEIVFKCAKALDYAHRQGVIHRDIKPTNILLTKEKNVKLGDFSIAHNDSSENTNTMPMGFIGSPRYMSPEQVQEDNINNQTDIFSLGIVMYELLTGRHPFFAESFSRLIHKVINEKQLPINTHRTDCPEILEKIIYRALAKDPQKRYKMGVHMAADLSLAFDFLDKAEKDISIEEQFNAIKQLDFFAAFHESHIWEIIRAASWHTFEPDDEIIVQGDIDDSFYIITSGTVEVFKDNKILGSLDKGDCFGEMAYLTKTERTATIRAKDYVSLMKINSTSIDQVSTECQLSFSRIFMNSLVKRLSISNSLVVGNQITH